MRIVFVIDQLGAGGKERQLVELLKAIENRSDIHYLVVILSDHIFYESDDKIRSRMRILKRKLNKDPSIFNKLYRMCREFRADLLHCWDTMSTFYSIPTSRLLKIKLVNGLIRNAPEQMPVFNIDWVIIRLTFSFADWILGNSAAGLKAYRAPYHKSSYIHNGYDASRTKALQPAPDVRKTFDVQTQKVVGMVARFYPEKDHSIFILSALRLLQWRDDVTFVLVGDGPTVEPCRLLIPFTYQNRFRFVGKQKDVESIINIFDVGVLSAKGDGISNAIMEYMALGKPVVATNHGGSREIVVDRWTGFLVPPGDAQQMAEKIAFLLDNEEAARAMGDAGQTRLMKEFSMDIMVSKYVTLWRHLLPDDDAVIPRAQTKSKE